MRELLVTNKLPDFLLTYIEENYTNLWELRPPNTGKVLVYNKVRDRHISQNIFRRYTSYGKTPEFDAKIKKSYMFVENNSDLPKLFQPFFDFARSLDENYNEISINWYRDGTEFIEPHSDCSSKMIENYNILIINLCSLGGERPIELLHRSGNFTQQIHLKNGEFCIMYKEFNEKFRHGIPRDDKIKGSRISITFRQMREENDLKRIKD